MPVLDVAVAIRWSNERTAGLTDRLRAGRTDVKSRIFPSHFLLLVLSWKNDFDFEIGALKDKRPPGFEVYTLILLSFSTEREKCFGVCWSNQVTASYYSPRVHATSHSDYVSWNDIDSLSVAGSARSLQDLSFHAKFVRFSNRVFQIHYQCTDHWRKVSFH